MKILKKVNRGVIITVILLMGVITYLVGNSINNSRNIPILQDICEDYMDTYITYTMLPERYRSPDISISEKELEGYISEMRKDFSAFYPDEEMYYKFPLNAVEAALVNQANTGNRIVAYTKKIISFDNFEFRDDSVKVSITTEGKIDRVFNVNSDNVESSGVQQTLDEIMFIKHNNEWKVIYSQINEPAGQYAETSEKYFTGEFD